MRDLALVLVVFVLLPFVLKKPHIGILLWSWVGYMNPHRLTWGFAFSFPFAMIIGVVTLIGVLFSKEPKKIPLTMPVIILIILNIWFLVTTYFSLFPADAWVQWDKVFKIQLMGFLTLMFIRGRERIDMLVWVIIVSIGFYGVKGGIFTLTTGGQHMVLGPAASFISGNTEIALALAMILPLMRYLQLNSPYKLVRYGLALAMVLCAISIVGSYSRGAFLAGAAMAAFLWWKSRKKAWIAVMLVAMIPLLLAFMPQQWHQRMDTIQTYEEDLSAMGRINAWWFAFHLANDRPLVGGGFQAFDRELFHVYAPEPEHFQDAHSIYFQMLGEQGYVGLFLFLLLGFVAWRTGSRIIKKARGVRELKWAYDLASMTQVSLVAFAVGGAFLGLAYFDLFYHLIAILVMTNIAADQKLKKAEQEPASAPDAPGKSIDNAHPHPAASRTRGG